MHLLICVFLLIVWIPRSRSSIENCVGTVVQCRCALLVSSIIFTLHLLLFECAATANHSITSIVLHVVVLSCCRGQGVPSGKLPTNILISWVEDDHLPSKPWRVSPDQSSAPITKPSIIHRYCRWTTSPVQWILYLCYMLIVVSHLCIVSYLWCIDINLIETI
jgi:hypothetical protein